jgi:acyl-coenzyme A synthetase/AMP-(fatty) acid ligase
MVAVWKAGGALSTMDPSYPDLRLLDMIAALDANIVITDPRNALRFQSNTTHVVSDMENLPELLGQAEYMIGPVEAWSMGDVQPDDLAFVAWTSGSSGKPKGVLHTHDRLTSEHQSYEWNHEYNDNARILQFGSYAYIAGVGDNFRTMLHGATLCVPSETERTSALAQFINRSKSTRSYMTPSVLRTLDPAEVPSLKHLCIGGEPIDRDLERLWSRHVHFLSLYGGELIVLLTGLVLGR